MSQSWTVRRVVEWTAREFERRGIGSARLDAELLLAHALGLDRIALYMDLDRPLEASERDAFRALVERRRRREPVAYLLGSREFWSLQLELEASVLVPRAETEVLVEVGLALLGARPARPRVVDVGTGSGCVALAVASERPDCRVLAVDLDPRAARLARRNADRLGLGERVAVLAADLLAPVGGPVDLVLSNPPYLASGEIDRLEPEVSAFEPRLALDGGPDGLALYRRLALEALSVLAPGGALAVEVGGDEQAAAVEALLSERYRLEERRRDYGGVGRVVVGRRAG